MAGCSCRRSRSRRQPRTFAKLLQCRKFLSHVYKKFNACTFHILCSVAQWDVWQEWSKSRNTMTHSIFRLFAPLCLCLGRVGYCDASPVGSSQLAHICLSICRAVLLGLVACPVACLVACCMWQQREAATTAYSVCN